ncbi:TPA: hypothetical protein OUE92_001741 [Serratia marcescens]|nr:hypothetical protein [Serratia marcescens]
MNIDYPAALVLHQMALEHYNYPQYQQTVEVMPCSTIISDLHQHSLIATLWTCSVRINEDADAFFATGFLPLCAYGDAEAMVRQRPARRRIRSPSCV